MALGYESGELHPGSALGPYDLLAPIGVGGMAQVWAAGVRGTANVVAIKVLLPELAENVEFRMMFFDEARIASRVRHPNVCDTLQMGEQDGVLFLAMEWLDGPSLMRIVRPGREGLTEGGRIPLRPRLAARIIADACAGLQAAHDLVGDDGRPLGVVHRDVSPHNLLVTSAGVVKVTDFGIAKAIGKSHMTMAGQLKGKLSYMAPEQLVGGSVDCRCDVFALGCVLYEITTGQLPFTGEHDPEVMRAIILGRYRPPTALMKTYPDELTTIVVRALACEAEDRYQSAEHMRQALEKYLRNSGPSVGASQIAALVHERCGDELVARGNALRQTAAANAAPVPAEPSDRNPVANHAADSADSGNPAIVFDRGSESELGRALWMVAAVLLGAALGIGVLSYVRTARRAKSAIAREGVAAAWRAAGSAPTFAVATPGRVRLHVTPEAAVVIIDGVVLARGTNTLERPANGATVSVLVRADKHEDSVVVIDSASPEDVAVTLVPSDGPPRLRGD